MKFQLKNTWLVACAAFANGGQASSSWDLALESTERASARAEQTSRKLPVNGPITSAYGVRVHPLTEKQQKHQGIDIAAAEGTTFFASQMGRVTFAGAAGSYGNMVELQHVDGSFSRYAHASKLFVQAGDRIHRGMKLGLVGSTGAATGPHLHFELIVDGQHIDPVDPKQLVSQKRLAEIRASATDDNEKVLAIIASKYQTYLANATEYTNSASPTKQESPAENTEANKAKSDTIQPRIVSRLVPFKHLHFRPPAAINPSTVQPVRLSLDYEELATSVNQQIEQITSSLTIVS